ncbi:hypothetical protein CHGG_09586 [Chaetomium globosum CBS 148.51]|uniref:Uncharacterized protein n=1 Tax=Chaetomium globosum (strain ATCC 6205 / CBS 148.51 / DSM 1962 / NBRC 6347 / NRRL 1970) TaxID=306901 RepID=Q2GR18_CHAGB|nr:uncharacterized protein CHGG_09586 [Chaetomium globosum CBS 148.51]EAQ83182.1 hypothetical protein CHGG_09586 [Chaetomium globosum CBS 148.51]
MASASTLILFGPGVMTLDEPYFNRIFTCIKDDAHHSQWALHAAEDLESCWDSLCKSIPKLQRVDGRKHARTLADWLRAGTIPPGSTVANLPNAILGPLVLLAQLIEYIQHLKSVNGTERGFLKWMPPGPQTEAVGCCLGCFSAIVVSGSSSWAQFCHNAAAALRVMFVICALSDAQDSPDETGPSTCLNAFWRGTQSASTLTTALEAYPNAYVAVLYDENRATITTSAGTAPALATYLETVGIKASLSEFHGRFHTPEVYERDIQALFSFCQTCPTFQVPDAAHFTMPTRINAETPISGQENPLEAATRAFLAQQFNWIGTFRAAAAGCLKDKNALVLEFGPERCIPPTLLRRLSRQVTHFDLEESLRRSLGGDSNPDARPVVSETDIAVIGMACNVAGAQDLGQYWQIMLDGTSQHRELIPNDRFVMETTHRPGEEGSEKKKWYGNFLDDTAVFDHKFFKKSPREALHMDPQQRLILQTAYQAVAQAGYYFQPKGNKSSDRRIGCYIGAVTNDYEYNISHAIPNAFSATGALRSYIAGKVSHFFGWTGPAMTLDTACSASTVAIDLAIQAILSGECSAALIRQIFGGSARAGMKPLQIGSAKGLVGHTEGASGIVALIKVLLMILESRIPLQASFNTLNPAIQYSPSDNMEIAKASLPWTDDRKVAMINNYGAAGSNASILIQQAPKMTQGENAMSTGSASSCRWPFYISGLDDKAIQAYAAKLHLFLRERPVSGHHLDIENVSFNVNRQSMNGSLGRAAMFAAGSIDELEQQLGSLETAATPVSTRPVILAFGGQVGKVVGLDREVFDKSTILRHHLDDCDRACKSIQAGSIYPTIFQREPINDPSVLQPVLFSLQYACAKSWIDCGVEPAALVGHSFGELTALCISGVLSLEDTLRMVHGRSKVIRDSWGAEPGSMVAVEGDPADVENVIAAVNAQLDNKGDGRHGMACIACVNGPRSFTLAGSVAACDAVQQHIEARDADSIRPTIKHKRIHVTNAFHSGLVEPLKPELLAVGSQLTFRQPRIPLERETEGYRKCPSDASYVAEHMRDPVYWLQAVERLASKYPDAIWLEAGSNSTITNMASKALGMPRSATFLPVNITGDDRCLQHLVDITMGLWRAGVHVAFWPHSRAQTHQYAPIMLPPYQFERNRHWLDFKPPLKQVGQETQPSEQAKSGAEGGFLPPSGPYTFVGYKDNKTKKESRFLINNSIKSYVGIVSGHVIAKQAPVLPVPFAIDLAIQAITSICPELTNINNKLQPRIYEIVNHSPLIHTDPPRTVFIDFERHDDNGGAERSWIFKFVSKLRETGEETLHMHGKLSFQSRDDGRLHAELGKLERFVTHERCLRALESNDGSEEVIQGRSIYKVGDNLFHYGDRFRGLQKLVGRSSESAGRLARGRSAEAFVFDPTLADAFEQVGSIWANCMARDRPTSIYLVSEMEQWIRSPDLESPRDVDSQGEWDILAQHKRLPSGDFLTDIFVFGSASQSLEEVMLGIRYKSVPVGQLLTGVPIPPRSAYPLAEPSIKPLTTGAPPLNPVLVGESIDRQSDSQPAIAPPHVRNVSNVKKAKDALWPRLQRVLAEISGLELDEITRADSLADVGIDSLMGLELARDIETEFDCTLEQSQLISIVDITGILDLLQSVLDLEEIAASSDSSDTASSEPNSAVSAASRGTSLSDTPSTAEKSSDTALSLPASITIEAFRESKDHTDSFLKSQGCAGYLDGVYQKQVRLCLVLTTQAFKELGCDLEAAQPGDVLQPVPFVAHHRRFHEYLYKMLEETRIIDIEEGGVVRRTGLPLPSQSADAIIEGLMKNPKGYSSSHQLLYKVGSRMADVLAGKVDGPALIFGDAKNRESAAHFYGEFPFNKAYIEQMGDFLTRLARKGGLLSQSGLSTPLKIMEMGAGTGGTTRVLAPILAEFGIPVEYTFTDLSPSLVSQAKKKFKQYPFMKFAVHDIEQPPDPELMGSQHIVVATNAVHATHSIDASTRNIRKFLRSDGVLMLLEMMGTLHWVDVVWGTLEGWWLFDDGRTHAIVKEKRWEQSLLNAGFKHVEWTDGNLPEVGVQRFVIAMAADLEPGLAKQPSIPPSPEHDEHDSEEYLKGRKLAADKYIASATRGFAIPEVSPVVQGPTTDDPSDSSIHSVLVTGATGSLGSHIVSHLASLPSIGTVFCLNRTRPTRKDEQPISPQQRQREAFESRGIELNETMRAKLEVIETDTSQPQLGLDVAQYGRLVGRVTHIIHNAFPVNGLRALEQNEPQFIVMRNLVDLAAGISAHRKARDENFKCTFQQISSLSAVGKYPFRQGNGRQVPEAPMDIECSLPNGYGGAKIICERILNDTLGRHPDRFRAMTVRLGQVSGSKRTGYWNHVEVLAFLFKSAQTLRAFPAVEGVLNWLPLEEASTALAELLLRPSDDEWYPVYHVDNPVPRAWADVVPVFAEALGVPQDKGIVSLQEWRRRVAEFPGENPWDNPAAKAQDFFEHKFELMSCGGVTMATTRACRHSPTLRAAQPVSDELIRKYVEVWKTTGFLR